MAPDIPASVASFDAIYEFPGEVELRWNNAIGEYYEQTNIDRKVQGINSSYVDFLELPFNTVNYVDNAENKPCCGLKLYFIS